MVKKVFHITALFLFAIVGGCDPYRFTVETQHPIDCRIYSDHNSVNGHLYGFDMKPDAVVGAKSTGWTQYHLKTYMTLHGGEGFEMMLRPIVEENIIDSGFTLTFSSTNGLRIDSAGKTLDENSSFRFPKDTQVYITVYNEESFLRVTVGCDTVLRRYTKRRSSDAIVLKTLSGSELHVLDPEWIKIKFTKNSDVKAGE